MKAFHAIAGRAVQAGIVAGLLLTCGTAFSQDSGEAAAAAAGAKPDSRLPCPPDAKVDEAVEIIRAAYEADYEQAKTTGEPDPLIETLTNVANKTPDAAKKYALLLEAEALATQYEAYATALNVLANRAELFQVDGLKLKGQLLKRLAGPKVAADLVLFDQASDTAEQAMQAERFEVAAEAASLALSVAKAIDRKQKADGRKRGGTEAKPAKDDDGATPIGAVLVKKATTLQARVTASQKLFAEYGEALTRLKEQPDDAAAHSVVAKYLCFARGEWQKGLPALAKSDLENLKKVAADEISLQAAGKREPKEVFELAGAWWSASESKGLTEDQKDAIKDHAAGFYAEVVEGLKDVLEKQLAKSRLRGLAAKVTDAGNQSIVYDFSRPNQLEKFMTAGVMRETSKGLEFPGGGVAWIDSRQSFSGPLSVTFVASTFADKNHDIFPGIYVSSHDELSFRRDGIHMHWGGGFNTRTAIYVFGRPHEIRHRPIEAGRDYKITMSVDKERELTIRIDEDTVYQEVLPSALRLEGAIRMCGGIGHVIYRSATVVGKEKQADTQEGVQPDPGSLSGFRGSVGKTLSFNVVGTTGSGSVWGSNPYTADSRLARAAVHAGVLRPGESGVVRVTILPGQQSYDGIERNAVTTRPWGPYSLSYRIEPAIGGRGPKVVFLSDLPELQAKVVHFGFGKGTIKGRSPIRSIVDGRESPHGLSMHPGDGPGGDCFVKYALPQGAVRFSATTTLDQGGSFDHCGIGFEVIADGKSVWKSKTINKDNKAEKCDIALEGCRNLELRTYTVTAAHGGHAVWIEPCVTLDGGGPAGDAARDPIVGRWRWFVNGGEAPGKVLLADGGIKNVPDSSWVLKDRRERRYELSWVNRRFIDKLTLSADGNTLSGRNQNGDLIEGKRDD